jgi:hypothetical protein
VSNSNTLQTCLSSDTISSLFHEKDITEIWKEVLDIDISSIAAYWKDSVAHKLFLDGEGDVELKLHEWKIHQDSKITEDFLHLDYSHARNLSYAHPRTTMLMFGPKNAAAQQTQFLYIDSNDRGIVTTVLVTTVTQFDGFPFADKFKVVQYWLAASAEDTSKSVIKVGVKLYFNSGTIFKSQIISGTVSELKVLSEHWARFLVKSSSNSI